MLSPKAFAAFALSSLILLSHPIIADDSQLSADSIARLGKIIGGTPVSSRDYPWIVALETATMQDWGGYQFCGGTLIAPNKVLTAAHCSNELPNKSLRVRVGSNQVDTGGTLFKVKTQAVHPKYNKSTSDYDVAVWTLDKPVILSDDINLIELPEACSSLECITGVAVPSTNVSTAGWGATTTNPDYPTELMHVSLPLVSNATCQIAYGNSITSRMICAGVPAGGKDSCWGDSGGPLFAYFPEARAGIQTGIVSWGEDCGLPGYYGVYTRISNPDIRTFIRQKAGV